jgi:hypothetical protein
LVFFVPSPLIPLEDLRYVVSRSSETSIIIVLGVSVYQIPLNFQSFYLGSKRFQRSGCLICLMGRGRGDGRRSFMPIPGCTSIPCASEPVDIANTLDSTSPGLHLACEPSVAALLSLSRRQKSGSKVLAVSDLGRGFGGLYLSRDLYYTFY